MEGSPATELEGSLYIPGEMYLFGLGRKLCEQHEGVCVKNSLLFGEAKLEMTISVNTTLSGLETLKFCIVHYKLFETFVVQSTRLLGVTQHI